VVTLKCLEDITMEIVNEVLGTPECFQTLLDMDIEGSVSMLHLLKFRERAFYEDGRGTTLTGAEAYQLYLRDLEEQVESVGGRLVLSKRVQYLVLGQAEELWDAALVVEYPSKETFVEVVTSPEMLKSGVHRRAGLDGQLLIALSDSGIAEAAK
jgi:uncharacterized protein (DUF1330 family)